MDFFKKKYLVVLITILGILLRFVQLGNHPVSLNLDEVAIGYNAYSILQTGKDEYGTSFPIAFRSHDDYKAPLYIYLSTIPIALFGLNAFAVRFTSALAGVIAIPLCYLLVKELRPKSKKYRYLPELATLFLAISPWHIQFSRASFETNVATTLIMAGVYFYLKGLKDARFWIPSAVAFAVSLYTYHSNKIFLPLFALVLGWHARKQMKTNWRILALGLVIAGILAAPLIPFSLSEQGRLRFKGTSVFNTPTIIQDNNEWKIHVWRAGNEYQAKLFHNSIFAGTQVFLKGYFTHFTFDFLFWGLGMPVNHTPNVGLLYLWELPILIIGLYALFREDFKYKYLIIGWLLLVPVASGLTWDAPSSTRTTIMLPTWQILSAIGLIFAYHLLKKKRARKGFLLVSSGAITFFFVMYLHNYYRIAPLVYAKGWDYGVKEIVEYLDTEMSNYEKVVVSTHIRQPQNQFAFYLQYDPKTYLEVDGGTVSGGFNETNNAFNRYEFHPINWDQLEPGVAYVAEDDRIPAGLERTYTVNYPNGEPAISIVQLIEGFDEK